MGPLSAVCVAQTSNVTFKGNLVHPTRVLVKFKDADRIQSTRSTSLLNDIGVKVRERFNSVPGLAVLDDAAALASKQSLVKTSPASKIRGQRLLDRIERLRASGLFDYVEPDYMATLTATPTDAAFTDGTLWGLRNVGQNGGAVGADIGVVQAWNLTTGSADVVVAVIDTGIRYTHQDLASRMWRNPGEIPENGIDDDGDGYTDNVYGINAVTGSGDPMDDNGHGTHVAGTIGAAANDGNPQVGVAWNVRLMACKAGDENGRFKTSDMIKCIDFALAKGAKIVNASFGSPAFSQAQFDAIAAARDRGVLFVAAAGNNGTDNDSTPSYPASYPLDNIISVAAINRFDQLASFSNYGRTNVQVAAPGEEIFSCWNDSDTDYKTEQGTSMAAPHVSGVAALILSRYPSISLPELRNRILNTVIRVPALQNKVMTGGRVNAFNALNASPNGNLELSIRPLSDTPLLASSTVQLRVKVTDLIDVTNATISGVIQGMTNLVFVNKGNGSDEQANDSVYSAFLSVPPFANELTLNLSITAPGKTATNQTIVYSIVPPAINDDFDKRTFLTGSNLVVTGSNIKATKEAGEPNHAGNSGGKSVWWSWTAPATGLAIFATTGSSFDTLLAVYTGSALTALVPVASNDDTVGQLTSSLISFNVSAGSSYQIAVDGFGGSSGNISLKLSYLGPQQPPTNDAFENRLVLTGATASLQKVNTGATKQAGEPNHAGNSGGSSIWYSWKAPFNGKATVTTSGSSFDTLLGVYVGSTIQSLSQVIGNDDESEESVTSRATFNAVVGVTYQIAVDGFDGSVGIVDLTLQLDTQPAGPSNDNFVNKIALFGSTIGTTGSNVGADREAGEPLHAGKLGVHSVWWSWAAPQSGIVTISTAGSDFDTLLGVYVGSSVLSLTTIAGNDDVGFIDKTSLVTFYATQGTTYQIAVEGYSGFLKGPVGTIKLSVNLTASASRPTNDDFANRDSLSGANVTATGSNVGATRQAGEPLHAGKPGGKSVWWTWTPPSSGFVTVSTFGSAFDTLLEVYTVNAVNILSVVAANDDDANGGSTSRLSFNAVAGIPYQIAVDGYQGASGRITLKLTQITTTTVFYSTGFEPAEGYVAGLTLVGQNGWAKVGSGGNAIVTNLIPGYGQNAYVGFNAPSPGNRLLSVYKSLSVLPQMDQRVRFAVVMEIMDSTNGAFDDFRWSFFNSNIRLFSINFSNATLGISYLLQSSTNFVSTGKTFEHGTPYSIAVIMDLNAGTWYAYLNGEELVTTKTIASPGTPLILTDIDASWVVRNANVPGNNYMLFDDYRIEGITILSSPTVVTQPQNQTVTAGASPSLSVGTTGSPPPGYQWFRNGSQVPGATSATLTLTNVNTNQAGLYRVVINNSIGSVTSQDAVLLVNPAVVIPLNDSFASRIVITGGTNIVFGVNRAATKEASEPLHAGNVGGRSVWWSWTAQSSGIVTVSTLGSDFDTLLAVYTGTSIGSLTPVASSDDAQKRTRGSRVQFNAIANTTFQIAVDGFNADSGDIRLAVGPTIMPQLAQLAIVADRSFQLTFGGEAGLWFDIQASTNLTTWTTLTNRLNDGSSIQFTDLQATNFNGRFYRAIREP